MARFRELAPHRTWLKLSQDKYVVKFSVLLSELDPDIIWSRLHAIVFPHEPVLLCFEPPGTFCHRRLVAEWFERELGKVVDELEAK